MTTTSAERNSGLNSQESLLNLPGVRIVGRRENGLVEAFVPLRLIHSEAVPVDLQHVRDLIASMQKEEAGGKSNGQLSPLLLGEVQGSNGFYLLDGFHRNAALKTLGKTEAFTTIRLGCTMEDIVDLRIISAVSHKTVKFTRIIEWAQDAWNLSPWHDKIKLTQAFFLRFARGMTGARIGLDKEEAEKVKKWVDKKTKEWGINAPTLYQHLLTAQIADPDLLKSVRLRSGGTQKLEFLTPNHLAVIARLLPNRYELQQLVAEEIVRSQLHVSQGKKLAIAVSQANTAEEAKRIIKKGSWATEYMVNMFPGKKRESESVQMRRLSYDLCVAEERIATLLVDAARLRREIISEQKPEPGVVEIVKRAIPILPSKLRTPFILHIKYGFSPKDIAKIVGEAEGNMAMDIDRAWGLIDRSNVAVRSKSESTQAQINVGGNGHVQESKAATVATVTPPQITESGQGKPKTDVMPKPVVLRPIVKSGEEGERSQHKKPERDPVVLFENKTNNDRKPDAGGVAKTVPPAKVIGKTEQQKSKDDVTKSKQNGNSQRQGKDRPAPENSGRPKNPEDFKTGGRVWFLNKRATDQPGVILKTEFVGGVWSVVVEFPPMNDRAMYASSEVRIPISHFPEAYRLG